MWGSASRVLGFRGSWFGVSRFRGLGFYGLGFFGGLKGGGCRISLARVL